jgi:DNA-binding MarR family transcriptional regulator
MQSHPEDDTRPLLDRLLHLGRILYRRAPGGDLTPAQWAALRYFGRANRFSRTVSALSDYHGTTRGTASRMVSELEDRGLVRRRASARDGRRVRIDVTPEGKELLEADPLRAASAALAELPQEMRQRLAGDLEEVSRRLARRTGCGPFGTCGGCRHLEEAGSAEPGACLCRAYGARLDADELGRICADYEPLA